MQRYIEADEFKREMEKYLPEDRELALKVLKKVPTADVVERKRGKWIEYVNSHCECPFCHKEWSFFENMTELFNFCPNCGAELGERGRNDGD